MTTTTDEPSGRRAYARLVAARSGGRDMVYEYDDLVAIIDYVTAMRHGLAAIVADGGPWASWAARAANGEIPSDMLRPSRSVARCEVCAQRRRADYARHAAWRSRPEMRAKLAARARARRRIIRDGGDA